MKKIILLIIYSLTLPKSFEYFFANKQVIDHNILEILSIKSKYTSNNTTQHKL